MGLMEHLQRVTAAGLQARLESGEPPETTLPRLARELARGAHAAREAETKARSALQSAQRRLDEATGKASRLQRGAELALKLGKPSLAREALAEQVQTDNEIEQRRREFSQAEKALAEAHAAREEIGRHQDQVRALLERVEAVRDRAADPRMESPAQLIMAEAAKIEEKVCIEQDEAEARRGTAEASSPSLDERLRALEREMRVEERVRLLKTRLRRALPATQDGAWPTRRNTIEPQNIEQGM